MILQDTALTLFSPTPCSLSFLFQVVLLGVQTPQNVINATFIG